MYYVYLPTHWCKKYNINNTSKISLVQNNDGSLSMFPKLLEKQKVKLRIDLTKLQQKLSPEIINKIIVGLYINPADGFSIELNEKADIMEIFNQKKLLNIEFVDFDSKHISCETPMQIEEPFLLLKTMIKKIKNMVHVMQHHYYKELIEKYEDEIDKSKLLIEKAVIAGLINSTTTTMCPIELHYTGLIAKELERIVDHAKELSSSEKAFLAKTDQFIEEVKTILEAIEQKHCEIQQVISILEMATKKIEKLNPSNKNDYHKLRILSCMRLIAETLTDWVVSIQVMDTPTPQKTKAKMTTKEKE